LWHVGEEAGCRADHLLDLLTGKAGGWPGDEGGHVQPLMGRHVKICGERCQPLLSLLRKVGHLGLVPISMCQYTVPVSDPSVWRCQRSVI
jgi:hypothetical protein